MRDVNRYTHTTFDLTRDICACRQIGRGVLSSNYTESGITSTFMQFGDCKLETT